MKHIFDPEVVAGPCRYPCDVYWHVHDEDLPANAGAKYDYSSDEKANAVK